jgi:internalin A
VEGGLAVPDWIYPAGGGRMMRMKVSKKTGERSVSARRRKKTPEAIAEERIDATQKSQETHLDLSGLGLQELPASIGQLTQLIGLDLSGNNLVTLPEGLGQLKWLARLLLKENQLTTLPDALQQLKHLYWLNVDRNKLRSLPEWFI